MKVKEIRELSSGELAQKEKAFKKDLFDLNYQLKLGNVDKPSRFRKLKKDIARIMTILRERESDNERSAQTGK
jgi:large subunit ribosomal protein L29